MKTKYFTRVLLVVFTICYILTACGNKPAESTKSEPSVVKAVETKKEETVAQATPQKTIAKMPILKNDTGKTIIQRISTDIFYNTSFMITSKSGTVVVADPYSMPKDVVKQVDLITNTHDHPDHLDKFFSEKFECRKSDRKVEKFSVKDINVTSIVSSHNGDELDPDPIYTSNVIYIFDVDGLRIVHMGDIGQTKLTDEQLKTLGKVDVAFMQFDNSYSSMSIENEKGLKLIEQLKPQIIIPTHSTPEATKKIGEIVGSFETVENSISLSKDDLKNGKRKVIDLVNTLYK